jgi:hypothetical protein
MSTSPAPAAIMARVADTVCSKAAPFAASFLPTTISKQINKICNDSISAANTQPPRIQVSQRQNSTAPTKTRLYRGPLITTPPKAPETASIIAVTAASRLTATEPMPRSQTIPVAPAMQTLDVTLGWDHQTLPATRTVPAIPASPTAVSSFFCHHTVPISTLESTHLAENV